MSIWNISFNEIEDGWTDDQFFMFAERASDRIKRENRASSGASKGGGGGNSGGNSGGSTAVSMSEFLARDRAEKEIAKAHNG
jgi:hypothetical protein